MVAKGGFEPGSLDRESGILPLSYRGPRGDSNNFTSGNWTTY